MKALIKQILLRNPQARDDDFTLLFSYWAEKGVFLPPQTAEQIRKAGNPHDVVRRRQDLQREDRESGEMKIQPSLKVQEDRKIKELKEYNNYE